MYAQLQKDGTIVMDAPQQRTLTHTPVLKHSKTNDLIWAEVWDDKVKAVEQGNKIAGWLSAYLQRSVSLVSMGGSYSRPTSRKYTPRGSTGGFIRTSWEQSLILLTGIDPTGQVSFADGFPLLVISQESLDDLNSRMKEPLTMERFR